MKSVVCRDAEYWRGCRSLGSTGFRVSWGTCVRGQSAQRLWWRRRRRNAELFQTCEDVLYVRHVVVTMSARNRILFGLCVSCLFLSGCGGQTFGFDGDAWIGPREANVAQGAESDFHISTIEVGVLAVDWSIREGPSGGGLAPYVRGGWDFHALYTAPNVPGVFHIEAAITIQPGKLLHRSATITVP